MATRRFSLRALIRPRVLVYPAVLAALLIALAALGSRHRTAEITVLRGIGAPFVAEGDAVRNLLRIKIRNRTGESAAFTLRLVDGDSSLVAPENPVNVGPGEQVTESVFVLSPRTSFPRGVHDVGVRVTGPGGFDETTPYKLLGPEGAP